MAISNLLSLQPKKLSDVAGNFGMKTTTSSGVKPLVIPKQQAATPTPTPKPGTTGLAPTNVSTTHSVVAQQPGIQQTNTPYIAPVATQPAPAPTQQPKGLFPSVVASLAARGTTPNEKAQQYTTSLAQVGTQPNAAAQNYTQQAANYGAQNAATGQQAIEIANRFGQQYADVGQRGAAFRAGQITTGTSPVAEGNAAVTAQTTAAQQNAIAQGEQAALQGVGYQQSGLTNAANAANSAAGQAYTGQGQQINALNSAAGMEYTGQGQQINALNNAAGYAQPAQNFPFVFDPITQSYQAPGVGGAAGGNAASGLSYNPNTDAQSFAQKVINHQIPYADAVRALGYAGNVAEGLLQSAITSAGGNLTQLQAQTGIQSSQEQQVQAYTSALQQGQNLQKQLQDLITSFNLNPNDLNAANSAVQKIAQNTSDPRYQQLQNYISEVANTYSQILTPPGGTATDTTRSIATSMLDATASGKSLSSTMQQLDNAAQAKIAGVKTITPAGGSASSGGSAGWY